MPARIGVPAPFLTTPPTILDLSSLISGTRVAHYSIAMTGPALREVSSPVYAANRTSSDIGVWPVNIVLVHSIQQCVQLFSAPHYGQNVTDNSNG